VFQRVVVSQHRLASKVSYLYSITAPVDDRSRRSRCGFFTKWRERESGAKLRRQLPLDPTTALYGKLISYERKNHLKIPYENRSDLLIVAIIISLYNSYPGARINTGCTYQYRFPSRSELFAHSNLCLLLKECRFR
jgi:hypothetical protein